MGNMSPVVIDAAILVVALGAYAMIWFVSRDLSRIAQIMARVLPLVFFAPMFIVLQPHLASLRAPPPQKAAQPQPPPAPWPPRPSAAQGPGSSAETTQAPPAVSGTPGQRCQ